MVVHCWVKHIKSNAHTTHVLKWEKLCDVVGLCCSAYPAISFVVGLFSFIHHVGLNELFFFCPYFDTPHNHLHHFVALVPLCWRHRLYISFIFGKLLAFRRHKSLSCVLHIPAAGSSTIFIFRWAHVIRLKIDFMRTMYLHAFHIEHAFQLMFPFV